MPNPTCTHTTLECPVELTIYGYTPSLTANAVFASLFALCCIAQIIIGIRTRFLAFSTVVALCCLLEALGYGGRLMLHDNPWSVDGFKLQLVCLILAPSFLAAGIYLTLQYLVYHHGREHSRIRPSSYPWIFITCDAISIFVQAVGGGLSTSANDSLFNTGNDLMIAGIAIQVTTMFFCLLLTIDTAFSVLKDRQTQKPQDNIRNRHDFSYSYKFYLAACGLAFLAVFIRCVYRIPEMAGGWGNEMMRNQLEFIVLDGSMISIASVLMTVAHPGMHLPLLIQGGKDKQEAGTNK